MKVKMVAVVCLMVGLFLPGVQSCARGSTNNTGMTSVHFYVSMPHTLTGHVNVIKYSDVILNVGGGYDKKTGVFTAPVTGVYQFFFSYQSGRGREMTDLYLELESAFYL
ncbi:hypothetical protein AGOR_G00082300 [Albula goreensis]|uniref:C1q domain-containing protein n=1 Tax=Albula goreensis TaxID=1534307 RepID=A0A8T3DIK9_9TELE|nr:hypothetical protein AGOR_G00082300 [Albula goreensis]